MNILLTIILVFLSVTIPVLILLIGATYLSNKYAYVGTGEQEGGE